MTAAMRDAVSPDLRATLRALKLGQMLHTLPDRLTLARQQNMTHADFLELVLADEHARREAKSASLRARAAGLDPGMRLDTWDPAAAVRYDQQLWNELASLRFLDAHHGALLLGPVGVGKTHLACALGHIAIRRRRGVHMARADKLFKRLKAARLDNTLDYEMRRLATVEMLIIDDLALQPLDPASTTDFYELCVERHQRAATIVTSNRTPDEWLTMMADPLLAQSAVDRLVSTAHEPIIEGPSYRQRQKPSINGHPAGVSVDDEKEPRMITHDARWSLSRGKNPVPSPWQATVAALRRDNGRLSGTTRAPASDYAGCCPSLDARFGHVIRYICCGGAVAGKILPLRERSTSTIQAAAVAFCPRRG